jgi:hypothetical protein
MKQRRRGGETDELTTQVASGPRPARRRRTCMGMVIGLPDNPANSIPIGTKIKRANLLGIYTTLYSLGIGSVGAPTKTCTIKLRLSKL